MAVAEAFKRADQCLPGGALWRIASKARLERVDRGVQLCQEDAHARDDVLGADLVVERQGRVEGLFVCFGFGVLGVVGVFGVSVLRCKRKAARPLVVSAPPASLEVPASGANDVRR